MLLLVMGVSGCGKTTIAQRLSKMLNIPLIEADDFHPPSNIEKMTRGIPLNDTDRRPWLQRLAEELKKQEHRGAVLACSALKEKYRDTLRSSISKPLWIIFLQGDFETIHRRMQLRSDHFMPAHLLQSQFDALEVPKDAWVYDVEETAAAITRKITERIERIK
ncbi:MAG: gluconokinase [Bacteroidota bacterium]